MLKHDVIKERRRRQQHKQRLVVLSFILVAALILIALVVWSSFEQSIDREYSISLGTSLGDPNAPVLIEDFSDFQCGHCAAFHRDTLTQVIDHYITPGLVRFEFRQFPILNEQSKAGANASLCAAEQDRFWEYADLLFSNQYTITGDAFSFNRLVGFAGELALDVDQFSTCLREERYASQIESDIKTGVSYGVNSTPSFIVNGKLLVGARPFSDMKEVIDAALMEAGSAVGAK